MRRSALTLLALALLLGSATAQLAAVSGIRAKFLRKHPHLAKHLVPVSGAPGGLLTPTAVPAECLSVAEVAKKAGNFSALLAAAQAAGLAPLLSDRALQATVFAPTDVALSAALEALGLTAEELLAQPAMLAAVLKYHIVPGTPQTSAHLSDSEELTTLLATDLALRPVTPAASASSSAAASSSTSAGAAAGSSAGAAAGSMATMAAGTAAGVGMGHKKAAAEAAPVEEGKLTVDTVKIYDLKKKEASRPITIVGTLSQAMVVVPDVQAGCPAVVHVIDNVLLPDLSGGSAAAGAAASADASM